MSIVIKVVACYVPDKVDYPVDKVSCYVSDDGAAMLTFEAPY